MTKNGNLNGNTSNVIDKMKDFYNAINEFKESYDELIVDIMDDKTEWKVIKLRYVQVQNVDF